jgi:hypothetical protein
MKVRIEAGTTVLHTDVSLKELVELARELASHSSSGVAVIPEATGLTYPPSGSSSINTLMQRVRDVSGHALEQWVRANPKGSTYEMLRELAGIGPEPKLTGDLHQIYVSAYNRLARTHRKLHIPAATKVA